MNQNNVSRPRWQRVDGVLLLDKDAGVTSNAALQGARRLFSAAKAGHTGTLDPMASGLLPVCFGEATKFSADLLEADKTYEAEIRFGVTTDTGDAEGSVLANAPVDFELTDLETALAQFRGRICQIPPMYSALKRDGQPLYKLARQGVEVERAPREVTLSELTLLDHDGERCRIRVTCSKGTYIRTLAEDIGKRLGCGAHLTALRRSAVGRLRIDDAVTLSRLNALSEADRASLLHAPDFLLQTLPAVTLDEASARRFAHGNPVPVTGDAASVPGKRRVYAPDRFMGLGEIDSLGMVCPRRLVCAP